MQGVHGFALRFIDLEFTNHGAHWQVIVGGDWFPSDHEVLRRENLPMLYEELSKDTMSANDLSRGFPKSTIYTVSAIEDGCKLQATPLLEAFEMKEKRCSICWEDFEEDKEIRRLPTCGHYFHRACIDKVQY